MVFLLLIEVLSCIRSSAYNTQIKTKQGYIRILNFFFYLKLTLAFELFILGILFPYIYTYPIHTCSLVKELKWNLSELCQCLPNESPVRLQPELIRIQYPGIYLSTSSKNKLKRQRSCTYVCTFIHTMYRHGIVLTQKLWTNT